MSRRASDWMFYLAPEAWERYKLLDMHDDLKQSQREASTARARSVENFEALGKTSRAHFCSFIRSPRLSCAKES